MPQVRGGQGGEREGPTGRASHEGGCERTPNKANRLEATPLVSEREAYEVLVQHERAPRPSPGQRVSEWEAHETLVHAERELLKSLESQGRSIPIVSKEIVERGGQSLVQIRISDSKLARHQVPGLDRPVFIPYTPDALGDGEKGEVTSSRKIVQTIGVLMQSGEVAVKPVVVYLALRPGRRLRTWVEGFDGTLEPAEQALLTQRTRENLAR